MCSTLQSFLVQAIPYLQAFCPVGGVWLAWTSSSAAPLSRPTPSCCSSISVIWVDQNSRSARLSMPALRARVKGSEERRRECEVGCRELLSTLYCTVVLLDLVFVAGVAPGRRHLLRAQAGAQHRLKGHNLTQHCTVGTITARSTCLRVDCSG